MNARDCIVKAREAAEQTRRDNLSAMQQTERAFNAYQLAAAKAAERVLAFDEVLAEIDKAEAEAEAEAQLKRDNPLMVYDPATGEAKVAVEEVLDLEPPDVFRSDEPMAVGHLPNGGYRDDLPAMQEQGKAA